MYDYTLKQLFFYTFENQSHPVNAYYSTDSCASCDSSRSNHMKHIEHVSNPTTTPCCMPSFLRQTNPKFPLTKISEKKEYLIVLAIIPPLR